MALTLRASIYVVPRCVGAPTPPSFHSYPWANWCEMWNPDVSCLLIFNDSPPSRQLAEAKIPSNGRLGRFAVWLAWRQCPLPFPISGLQSLSICIHVHVVGKKWFYIGCLRTNSSTLWIDWFPVFPPITEPSHKQINIIQTIIPAKRSSLFYVHIQKWKKSVNARLLLCFQLNTTWTGVFVKFVQGIPLNRLIFLECKALFLRGSDH